jgi:hypothetical protein
VAAGLSSSRFSSVLINRIEFLVSHLVHPLPVGVEDLLGGTQPERFGVARITGPGLFYRLREAETWLERLLAQTLDREVADHPSGLRLRVVDATVINGPGAMGTQWRAHVLVDPRTGRFEAVQLTDELGQQILIPLGDLSDPVIGYGVPGELRSDQAGDTNDGHGLQPQLSRRLQPGVTRRDVQIAVRDDGVVKAVGLDRPGHGVDGLVIHPWVARIGLQLPDGNLFNSQHNCLP